MTLSFKQRGAVAFSWWKQNISRRDEAGHRGLSARLRRADPIKILCEREVQDLGRDLGMGPMQGYDLAGLATLLAELRGNREETLAQLLGGSKPILSGSRFERLVRAEGEELTTGMRRAIHMLNPNSRACNVAKFAADLLNWKAARGRWCFEYFEPDVSAPYTNASDPHDSEETTE
ncbi:MAG: type I-E CRISPR-associated protein Cse2/CasB [Tabrizicola sp.]|uniref:type I-E CRISPR-associated protein Cse2/CasB n=1 Tax=Tabrizicola sp. TaxID=2005166 RepID=UPI003BB131F9